VVYYAGERIDDVTTHPALKLGIDTAAVDYSITENPENAEWATAKVQGEMASRYLAAPFSAEDLLARRRLVEEGSRACFGFPPFAKEGGSDALNGTAVASRLVDKETGSDYFERLEAFRLQLVAGDLSVAVAMTDPKGRRDRRPHAQEDPDLYLRVVDRDGDGIVLRGAKAHLTSGYYTNEIIVLPTRQMREDDAGYAVACAVPANAPGVSMIVRPVLEATVHERPVAARADMVEALCIFDDVFVPHERVFLLGEHSFAGTYTERFATYHRVTAAAYKYPFAELMVGTALLLAEANGLEGVSHVREKIAWLATYAETISALSRAACEHPISDELTGQALPNPLLGNAAKLFFADHYHSAVKALQDIAGGLLVTAPTMADLANPEIGFLVAKYLAAGVEGAERLRRFKLAKDLVASDLGGFWEVTSLHAEGSLAAERMAIMAGLDTDRYRRAAEAALAPAAGSN
jgi:4-hydroxybutyryl-CoA dehydratase/vinylacetyl-CoA-Delta-isomerase